MRCAASPTVASLALLCGIAGADAQPSSPAPLETPLDADGVSALGKTTPKDCLVGSNVDVPTMIARMADLQDKGAIRPDVDLAHVKARAWTTASAILLGLQPALMSAVFKDHADIGRCGFVTTITGSNGKPEAAYVFTMTRAKYEKIDWSSFSQQDLPNVTERFTLGRVTAGRIKAESR